MSNDFGEEVLFLDSGHGGKVNPWNLPLGHYLEVSIVNTRVENKTMHARITVNEKAYKSLS